MNLIKLSPRLFILLALLYVGNVSAQSVGIGTTTPDNSAILDLTSTNKGLLMPRMTTAQRDAILTPTQGLKIFNTDDRCEDTYDGQTWTKNCNDVSSSTYSINPGQWFFKSTFPGGQTSTANCFVIDSIIYVIDFYSDFYSYNTKLDLWIKKADFPQPRYGGISFSLNGKGYFGLGYSDKKDLWEYNPSTNIWTQKPDFPGLGRRDAVVFTINNKAYIGTGYNNTTSLPLIDFWEFDPNASSMWSEVSSLPQSARTNAMAFSINSKGYVGAGWDGNYSMPHYYQSFYEFTPSISGGNGTWVSKATVPEIWLRGSGVSTNTSGYYGLGETLSQVFTDKFWKYNPTSNSWSAILNFSGGKRASSISCAISNQIYVGLGGTSGPKDDLWSLSEGYLYGKEYTESIPNDAFSYKSQDWTYSNSNYLRTTKSNVNVYIAGKLAVADEISIGDPYKNGLDDPILEIKNPTEAYSLTSTPLIKVGNDNNGYLAIDGDQIQSQNYSTAKTFKIQPFGGLTTIGGNTSIVGTAIINGLTTINDDLIVTNNATINGSGSVVPLNILGGDDASGTSAANEGFLAIGPITGNHILMDDNEIMAKSNTTTPTTLYLQTDGGAINIGSTNFDVSTAGALTIASSTAVKAMGSSWTNPSDIRLKQNINTFSSGLHDILKIRPVTFNYISRPKDEVIGVIAQELQQISPYMVSESKRLAPDGTPYLQVDNSAMTYMLINAVKEQQAMIDSLKKQIEDLKTNSVESDTKYDSLKAEIESIKLLLTSQNIVNNTKK